MRYGHRGIWVATLLAAVVAHADVVTVGHSATRPLSPGDVLTVVANGPANGRAQFRIVGLEVDFPMYETRPGEYRGNYTLRAGDSFNGRSVQVTVTTPDGQVSRSLAANAVGEPPLPDANTGQPVLPGTPGSVPYPNAGSLQVTRLAVTPRTWVTAGAQVVFDVQATPGCAATASITGVVKDIVLNERAAGQYSGSWTVPAQPLATARTTVTVRLRLGNEVQLFVGGETLAFDTVRPVLVDQSPANDSIVTGTVNRVVLAFDDGGGSGLDVGSVVATLDGASVAGTAQLVHNVLLLQPAHPLAAGRHQVRAVVQDQAGNPSAPVVINFVTRADGGAVTAGLLLTHSANVAPQAGDIIRVQLTGPANGRAVYSIGRAVTNRTLQEVRPGIYAADYLVERGDRLAGETVSATFVSFEGVRSVVQAATPVGGGRDRPTEALPAPRILFLNEGDTVPERAALRGSARPGALVTLSVTNVTDINGLVSLRGSTVNVQATADREGNWASPSITFAKPLIGGKTTYTITATAALGDRTSDATVLHVTR